MALSHGTQDGFPPEEIARVKAIYERSPTPVYDRTLAQVQALLHDFELVEPGLVRVHQWRPTSETETLFEKPEDCGLYGSVGQLPR